MIKKDTLILIPIQSDSESKIDIHYNTQQILNSDTKEPYDRVQEQKGSSKKLFTQIEEKDIELSHNQNNVDEKIANVDVQMNEKGKKNALTTPQKLIFSTAAIIIILAIIVCLSIFLSQKPLENAYTRKIPEKINSATLNLISYENLTDAENKNNSAFDIGIIVQPDLIQQLKQIPNNLTFPQAFQQNKIQVQKCMPYPPSFWDTQNRKLLPHISIDKPIYKQNDVIFIEVYLIDPITKQPYIESQADYLTAQQTISKVPEILIEAAVPDPKVNLKLTPPAMERDSIKNFTQIENMTNQSISIQQETPIIGASDLKDTPLNVATDPVQIAQDVKIQPIAPVALPQQIAIPNNMPSVAARVQKQWKSSIFGTMKILDSFNKEIYDSSMSSFTSSKNGTLVFTYKIPNDLSGGEYQIKITSNDFPAVWRKFRVNQNSQPDLFVTVDFDKNNYSPGDLVQAKIKVRRPDGLKLQDGSAITYEMMLGKNIIQSQITLNQFGEAKINETISANFKQKVLTLTVKTYIGVQRFLPSVNTFTVPILDRDSFQVDFYSETSFKSALVQNVPNKIYFQVHSKSDATQGDEQILEPIEFTVAQLIKVDSNTSIETTEVANIQSIHLGRSYFQFVPDANSAYYLQVFRSFNDEIFVMKKFWLTIKVDATQTVQMTVDNSYDDKVMLRVSTNDQFNNANLTRNLTVQVKNKDSLIYEGLISLDSSQGAQQKDFMITFNDSIYPSAPAGGVMTMKLTENKSGYPKIQNNQQNELDDVNLERLIFVKPSKKLEFNIQTDSDNYQPGQKVLLNISIDKSQVEIDEQIFASITVTDLSSFLKVDKAKLPPSLPAMVFLEKEIRDPINSKQIDEFYHSEEYLDAQFQSLQTGEIDELLDLQNKVYRNLDLLLSTQEWRRGKLDDLQAYQAQITRLEADSKQRAQLEYLLGNKVQQLFWGWKNVRFAPMAMAPMRQDMPMIQPMMKANAAAMIPMQAAPQMPVQQMGVNVAMQARVIRPFPIMPPPAPTPKKDKQTQIDDQQRDFMLNIDDNTRDYRHNLQAKYQAGQRIDFTQTLLFRSAQYLYPITGGASNLQLSSDFFLNDQVSSFQIKVNLFSSKGKYAVGKKTLVSSQNIYSKFTLPTSFVLGDQLIIPITVQNNFDEDKTISVQINQIINQNITLNALTASILVQAKQQNQVFFSFDTLDQHFEQLISKQFQKLDKIPIQMSVQLSSAENNYTDTYTQSSFIVLNGFNQQMSQSDRIILNKPLNATTKSSKNKTQKTEPPQTYRRTGKLFQINLPQSFTNNPRFIVKAYSQPLSNILDALQSLIQNPFGCFEQTSSTTYPMVMALQLLKEMLGSATDVIQIGRIQKMQQEIIQKLKDGYKRLLGFETPTKGYEWFGTAPGHEALTSYGLAQFQDMAQVVDFVDQEAIQRNQNWLLNERRNPNKTGKFLLSTKVLDTFGGAAQNITDAYIVWVLTQDGKFSFNDLRQEFKNLDAVATSTEDPYFLSLYAGALHNVGQNNNASKIVKRLAKKQNAKTGAVEGASTSITSSSGESLVIETTSLAVLNWMNLDAAAFASNIELAIGYLLTKIKDGGRFGSTQSTVLSLKALIAYQKSNGQLKGRGNLVLYLNDAKVDSFTFDQDYADPLSKFDFTNSINQYYQTMKPAPVNFTLTLAVENYSFNNKSQDFKLNYLMQVDYKDQMPPSGAGAAIAFNVSGSSQEEIATMKIGDINQENITILNIKNTSFGMVVAIVSVPSCLDIDMKQLEILKERGEINQYEISADKTSIILYWTYLKALESKNVIINRVKIFDGPSCLNRVSQAYLYYQDEFRVWTK